MARVPYLTEAELPEEHRYLFSPSNPFTDDNGESEAPWDGPQHTHRSIANNPEILEAYRRFGSSLWTETGLTETQRERSILAIARALESAYEWHQHVTIALDRGVPREEIEAISDGNTEALSPADRALVEYLQAYVDRSVTDADHERLAEHFDDATIVGIGMLAAYYIGIDYMGEALALDLEDEFVGWNLENV